MQAVIHDLAADPPLVEPSPVQVRTCCERYPLDQASAFAELVMDGVRLGEA